MKYKFVSENRQHLHLLDKEDGGDFRPLTGVSSAVSETIAKNLAWWAAGKALEPFGWVSDKVKDANGKFVGRKPQEELIAAAKEGLTRLEAFQLNPFSSDEDILKYVEFLDSCYRAHDESKKESATKGIDRHARAEEWIKSLMAGEEIEPDKSIMPFVRWARAEVKKFLWSEAHSFEEDLWVGGISDAGAELNNGVIAVIDIKSAKKAYASNFFQCGGYDLCISKNGLYDADGNKLADKMKIGAHIVFPFGMEKPAPFYRYDVEQNRDAFRHVIALYRQIQNYEI